jgi:hypothetical protein
MNTFSCGFIVDIEAHAGHAVLVGTTELVGFGHQDPPVAADARKLSAN